MTDPHLGPGAEFDTIRRIAAALGPAATGIGDDCAYIECEGVTLAVSTDASVEGIHFRRGWLSHDEIGWRAAAAALSDLAATGARDPRVLAAVTVPDRSEAVPLMQGVGAAASAVGGVVVGGDLTHGHDLTLVITVIGLVTRPMHRSGAKPGDGVWVTGHLGLARAALLSLQRGEAPDSAARTRFAHPEPRLKAGQWLVEHGATAMLDVSDGLAGDCRHIAAASNCRLEIELGSLPLHPAVIAAAAAGRVPPGRFAAEGGEDYELLVTLPAEFEDGAGFTRAAGLPLTRIGRCAAAGDGLAAGVALTLEGQALDPRGYDHFR